MGAQGGTAHTPTPGHRVQARAGLPRVFWVVPAALSPGRTRRAAPGQRCQALPRAAAREGSSLRSRYRWAHAVGTVALLALGISSPAAQAPATPKPALARPHGGGLPVADPTPSLARRASAPGERVQAGAAPPAVGLPWVCRGDGVRQRLHLPLALSHRWHRALQLLRLPAMRPPGVRGATVSRGQPRGPGCRWLQRGEGLVPWAQGADTLGRSRRGSPCTLGVCGHSAGPGWGPRQALCRRSAVPWGARGAVPAVPCRAHGAVPRHGALSLSQSEGGAAAPSPLAPFPGPARQNRFRNDWGSRPGPSLQRPALLSSPWLLAPQVALTHAARGLPPRVAAPCPGTAAAAGFSQIPFTLPLASSRPG